MRSASAGVAISADPPPRNGPCLLWGLGEERACLASPRWPPDGGLTASTAQLGLFDCERSHSRSPRHLLHFLHMVPSAALGVESFFHCLTLALSVSASAKTFALSALKSLRPGRRRTHVLFELINRLRRRRVQLRAARHHLVMRSFFAAAKSSSAFFACTDKSASCSDSGFAISISSWKLSTIPAPRQFLNAAFGSMVSTIAIAREERVWIRQAAARSVAPDQRRSSAEGRLRGPDDAGQRRVLCPVEGDGAMDSATREKIVAILAGAYDMTLATIRPDGYPQATTVGYVNDGVKIYFGTAADSQKARNIALCDKVSLTVTLPYDRWEEIRRCRWAPGRRASPTAWRWPTSVASC